MRTLTKSAILALSTLAMAGCSSGGLLDRDRPDEFAVQRQAPLVVPPDFNLVPPSEGAPRPVGNTSQEQALDVLFGGPAARSSVETSVLDRAGEAAPGIRSVVGSERTNTVAKGRITRDIIAAPEGDGQAAQAVIPG